MEYKRITILCGHYGSGKTNIAVNMAKRLNDKKSGVTLADLDIVNPYFRAKDSMQELKSEGIRFICSEYANSNVDIPALPQDMYAITDDKNLNVIIDVGGDDRGALALGRISQKVVDEDDYEMLMVINCYRPLTPDPDSVIEVMREIEAACRIKFTGLINNSNLGEQTTADDVIKSLNFADEVSRISGLPVAATTVCENLYDELIGKIDNLMSLKLQSRLF